MIIDGHIQLAKLRDELTSYDKYLLSWNLHPGWGSIDELLSDMDKDGVDVGILMEGSNTLRQRFFEQKPDRFSAFAGISLRDLKTNQAKTLQQGRHYIQEGFLGFGQISLYREGCKIDDPAFQALVELALDLDVPIHLEATPIVGEYVPGKGTTPLYDFEAIALMYPQLKLILSSWGGGLCLYEMMPELITTLANVYYDTACAADEFDPGVMMRTVPKVAFSRKIFYGSSSPRKKRDLNQFRNSGAPQEVIDGVLGNNIALFLGLKRKNGHKPPSARG